MDGPCLRCGRMLVPKESWYGLHQDCFKAWFGLSTLESFLDIAIRSQSQPPFEDPAKNSSFFHGKFRKYSTRLGKDSYILKVQQLEYPELPATEFLSNQIYENLKIKVPNYYLIRFPEEQICFVTKNFMSGLSSSTLNHIYHFVKEMRYDCETLVNIIGMKTGRRIEQEKFAYLTLADSLTGNNDRHGRNLGFILSANGSHYLAPFYDNPSALGVEESSFLEADLQPRGCIFTKNSDEPTMRDYALEWNRLGYSDVVDRFRETLSFEKLEKIIAASHISEKRQKALLQLISKRRDELWKIK